MRIAIVGNAGSGKSTLARRLAAESSLSTLDLDTVAWEPGQIAVARPVDLAVGDVQAFCGRKDNWVVEGCYAPLIAAALAYDPQLLFLDPGLEQCLANCRSRPWESHKYKSKAEQDKHLDFLLAWVAEYYTRQGDLSFLSHQTLFAGYSGPKHRLSLMPGVGFHLPVTPDIP